MANRIHEPTTYKCLVNIHGKWRHAICRRHRHIPDGWQVIVSPLPYDLAAAWGAYMSQGIEMAVDDNDPNFRLILSDEITYT